MTSFLHWLIPLIAGVILAVILNSDRAMKKLLNISTKLADAYYNKKKEKLKRKYKNLNDDIVLLMLSNEMYKIEFVKKPELIFILFLLIYSIIVTTGAVIFYILDYNVLAYALAIPTVNIIYILAIKIKQKLKSKGGNQQQHVI